MRKAEGQGIMSSDQGHELAGKYGYQSYIENSAFLANLDRTKDFLHTIVKVTVGKNALERKKDELPVVDESANP